MNNMNITEYEQFIGKSLFCIGSDSTFSITKGKEYKIVSIKEKYDKYYISIINDKNNKIGFCADDSDYFLGLRQSILKIRKLKLKSLFNENMDTE